MSYQDQDHLRTCSYCRKDSRPTIKIKSASSYSRERKLSGLAALITGASYPKVSFVGEKKAKTKGASMDEKGAKLSELGRMIRGV